jgi:hypothetical protein
MAFNPIPFRDLEDLRKHSAYLSKDAWFASLVYLNNSLVKAWADFKANNPNHLELIMIAETLTGPAPTRIDIATRNLYPVEEYYYNELYAYYYCVYEKYTNFLKQGQQTNIRDKLVNFKARLEHFYMSNAEIKACVAYILRDGREQNTLLALKAINRFSKFHGIRVQDVETVFKEWLL